MTHTLLPLHVQPNLTLSQHTDTIILLLERTGYRLDLEWNLENYSILLEQLSIIISDRKRVTCVNKLLFPTMLQCVHSHVFVCTCKVLVYVKYRWYVGMITKQVYIVYYYTVHWYWNWMLTQLKYQHVNVDPFSSEKCIIIIIIIVAVTWTMSTMFIVWSLE